MGILNLLRNAFGRSRKDGPTRQPEPTVPPQAPEPVPPTTEPPAATVPEPTRAPDPTPVPDPTPAPEPEPAASAEPETTPPAAEVEVPEPRTSTDDDHELVKAAFDKTRDTTPDTTPELIPEPEAAPEPDAAPEPETAPEPDAAPEPETAPEADAAPEPETAPEPEPAPEPAPVAATEPEPTPEADPKPEPELAPEPELVPEPKAAPEATKPTPSPAAADDENAPQGPPAPDNEPATGAAAGSESPAEGEAVAEPPAPTAEPPAEAESPAPTAEPELPKNLAAAHKAAATALREQNLTGTQAKVYLVLDRSASMRPYYKDGSAQALGEQALALAAHLDPEATVSVVFFSTELDGTGELTLGSYENKIDELHGGLGRMGRTSYHAAVEEVLAQHRKTRAKGSRGPRTPALVIFQTDGAPDAKTPATQAFTEAAKKHPEVFFAFVAFGEEDNKAFDYARKLKSENTAFFAAGPTPLELTDKELYEGVLASWRP